MTTLEKNEDLFLKLEERNFILSFGKMVQNQII